jgi:hypothetical protein
LRSACSPRRWSIVVENLEKAASAVSSPKTSSAGRAKNSRIASLRSRWVRNGAVIRCCSSNPSMVVAVNANRSARWSAVARAFGSTLLTKTAGRKSVRQLARRRHRSAPSGESCHIAAGLFGSIIGRECLIRTSFVIRTSRGDQRVMAGDLATYDSAAPRDVYQW